MSTDGGSQEPVRHAFFSPGWFDMVLGELQSLLLENPAARAWSFSLVERFENAPELGLAPPYGCAGLRLDIAGVGVQLRRGIRDQERANVMIVTQWDDASRAVLMPAGEEYAAFCAWRTSAGRFRREGVIEAGIANFLSCLHDRVAQRTSRYAPASSLQAKPLV